MFIIASNNFFQEFKFFILDYSCFSLFRFFDKVFSILKKLNANLLRNVCHMLRLNNPENVIKKCKYTEKKSTEHLRESRPKVAPTESSQQSNHL